MRFLLLVLPLTMAGAIACASEPVEESAADLTDSELARKALLSVGTKLDGQENRDGVCTQCHNHDANNIGTFKRWAANYKSAMSILQDATKSREERIALLRAEPSDPTSKFDTQKLGIITAGAHLGLGPNVSAEKHPNTYAQNKLIEDLFEGHADAYEQFRVDTLMPIEARYDRLSPGQYEAILTWMQRGMPELAALVPDTGRPTSCVEDFSKIKEHPSKVRNRSWATLNKEARIAMVACAAGADPIECFTQKHQGKDVFLDARSVDVGKAWSKVSGTVRIAQDLHGVQGHFWSRVSADGRFFALGGAGKNSKIIDLAAALDPSGPKTRIIKVMAEYDPDFFPGNAAFMYQGTSAGGGRVCAQSLLARPEVETITFQEPECSKLDSVQLYQTVAQAQGDNALSDLFTVNNANGADNPSSTAHRDLPTNAGPEAAAKISVAVSTGTEGGYKVTQQASLPLPFHGDTMASRTLELLGSRIEGKEGALGYAITRITKVQTANGYQFSGNDVARICMPGNKANFSFDERFLVTHHYIAREDVSSDAEFEAYEKGGGGSEILLADFVTGKKTVVLRTSPGQFALFPHFRSDGWIMFELRDNKGKNGYVMAADAAVRAAKEVPTP